MVGDKLYWFRKSSVQKHLCLWSKQTLCLWTSFYTPAHGNLSERTSHATMKLVMKIADSEAQARWGKLRDPLWGCLPVEPIMPSRALFWESTKAFFPEKRDRRTVLGFQSGQTEAVYPSPVKLLASLCSLLSRSAREKTGPIIVTFDRRVNWPLGFFKEVLANDFLWHRSLFGGSFGSNYSWYCYFRFPPNHGKWTCLNYSNPQKRSKL